ncbi:helix-turn-helix domain-containing protein [Parvimonas micra]|uniref:helix-turn-helix domain-containing protein n=1 Tax=Parvimonas micra TaxID=33033 RepID=UPI000F67186A|nr:helix-turn-helix domain-containing protein [Parvimonas micra]RSB90215.1 XRE family transcriptional regulator [Parvimonas micra]
MNNTFLNRLKAAMQSANLNQCELAKKSNITQSSISDWLNGKYVPKQDKIDALAQALNVTPAYLMGWEENSKELKSIEDLDFSGINRIAAHFEGDEFSEDDLTEIQNFINYVKQKIKIKRNRIMDYKKKKTMKNF